MERPQPKKHAECENCLEHAPLLMPVGFAPGFPVIVWRRMCLKCRLSERSDRWSILASDLLHSPSEAARNAYNDWLAAVP